MSPPVNFGSSTDSVISRAVLPVAEAGDVLCAGFSGDHVQCSIRSNVYYLASDSELCPTGEAHSPEDLLITPQQWYTTYRPCWTSEALDATTGMPRYVFSQPSSTFFVMLLAFACMVVGILYLLKWRDRDGTHPKWYHLSRLLWGAGIFTWGFAAFLAGLSYEALEWHLKCSWSGKEYCLAYSWLEIVYVIWQNASCNFLLVGVACSSQVTTPGGFLAVLVFASLDFLVYTCVVAIGGFQGSLENLSFWTLIWFSQWPMLIAYHISLFSYLYLSYSKLPDVQDQESAIRSQGKVVMSTTVMALAFFLYWAALKNGFQYELWCNSNYERWFTANDILHIVLIIWVVMVLLQLPWIKDSVRIRNGLGTVLTLPTPPKGNSKKNQ